MSVFRVVNISNDQEIGRHIDLVGACVKRVKHPNQLRVEECEAGSFLAKRVISRQECCDTLRRWLPLNPHFVDDAEREDMASWIDEACSGL
jgi:hypothetical protein